MGTKTLTGRVFGALPSLAALMLGLCAVLAVAFGAEAYAGIARRQAEGAAVRTADQFAAMKLRQASEWGGVRIIDDGSAVCRELLDDGSAYEDVLYWQDGWLMELYRPEGADGWGVDGDAGDRVIESASGSFRDMGGGLCSYDMSAGGRGARGAVHVRGGLE